jgi:hypothetical protein
VPGPPDRQVPPYGPAKGLDETLRLLERIKGERVDTALLRQNGIAPYNEYKVVNALKFLGLVGEDGTLTDKGKLLRLRGPAYQQHLKRVVQSAYSELFEHVSIGSATRDDIHNFFVANRGLSPEMARKATRFFLELCELADIRAGTAEEQKRSHSGSVKPAPRPAPPAAPVAPPSVSTQPMFSFVLSPALLGLDDTELAELFRRVRRAVERAWQESVPEDEQE